MRRCLRFGSLILFLSLAWVVWSAMASAAEDLEIWINQKRHKIDSRDNRGQHYYELKDIIDVFALQSVETRNEVELVGTRGRLRLSDGRPLARFGEEYILLSEPVWKRRERNWYVSEDFLTKALPLILVVKIEKRGPYRYDVKALVDNRVQVEVANFPDHVTIVFLPSQSAPIRVKEFQKYIEVGFSEYLVNPRLPETPPDRRIVSALDFVSTDMYGSFRIQKGEQFYNFREYNLTQPERKLIEVYGPPMAGPGPEAQKVPASEPSGLEPTSPGAPAARAGTEAPTPFQAPRFHNVIVIDPGHGGEEYGVHPTQEDLEKNINLQIATRIVQRLRGTAYETVLTRRSDVNVPLEHRSALANYYRSKSCVSIHTGGSPSTESKGPVVYVHHYAAEREDAASQPAAEREPVRPAPTVGIVRGLGATATRLVPWEEGQRPYLPRSRELADLLQKELNDLCGTNNQVVEVPLAVLAPVMAPAVLVEVGFLTSPEDHVRLESPDFQEQVAAVIAAALLKFNRQ